MNKNQLGYKNNRWHPINHYNDWHKFIETDEGKAHLEEIINKEKKLQDNRSKRINYAEELKRTDLTMIQRQHYRKKLKEQIGESNENIRKYKCSKRK
tara:strand:+ start:420 stop:710 length:291 start_codon:yes stop_codon:yes gene_type:complete